MSLTETRIRDQFIQQLKRAIPSLVILEQRGPVASRYGKIDMILKVRVGDVQRNLVCEIKSIGEPRYVFQGLSQAKLFSSLVEDSYPILVVPHMGEEGKNICKSSDIGYVDLDGNCFIKFDSVFIQLESDSREASSSFEAGKRKKRFIAGLYSPLSSRIVRTLLLNVSASWTLKELSENTHVSMGYVFKVAKSLEAHGYAVRNHNYRLKVNRPRSLLDEWAASYDFVRINRLHGFYTFDHDLEVLIQKLASVSRQRKLRYALTLHAGAFKVAPYTRFADIYCYVDTKDIPLWVSALDLRPVDRGGTVFLVEPFDEGVYQGIQSIDKTRVVSDVQLYVDLYNFPARGREQAEFLIEKRIHFS